MADRAALPVAQMRRRFPALSPSNCVIGIACIGAILGTVGIILSHTRWHNRKALVGCCLVTTVGVVVVAGLCARRYLVPTALRPIPPRAELEQELRTHLQEELDELMPRIREDLKRDLKTSGPAATLRNEAPGEATPIDLCQEATRITTWRQAEIAAHPQGFARYAKFSTDLLANIYKAMDREQRLLHLDRDVDDERIIQLREVMRETAEELAGY